MMLRLYDTYSRSLRDFKPLHPPTVDLYACGPTVYDYAHIGNLRTYIFEDILRRVLAFNGYQVNHVVNITDVGHLVSDADTGDDKMEKGSRRTGKSAWEIAELYTQAFKDDLHLLTSSSRRSGVKRPTTSTNRSPSSSASKRTASPTHLRWIIYTSRLPDYGYLARLDIDGLHAGARVDVARNGTQPTLPCGSSARPTAAADGMGQSVGRRFPGLAYRMFGDVGQIPGDIL